MGDMITQLMGGQSQPSVNFGANGMAAMNPPSPSMSPDDKAKMISQSFGGGGNLIQGGAQLGGTMAGNAVGGPIGGAIGNVAGKTLGNLIAPSAKGGPVAPIQAGKAIPAPQLSSTAPPPISSPTFAAGNKLGGGNNDQIMMLLQKLLGGR